MPRSTLTGAAVIGQGGGPTAVINQSLLGVADALAETKGVKKILAMRHGVAGLVKSDLINLSKVPPKKLRRAADSPSAALGSTRDKPTPESCAAILEACKKNSIRFLFYIGGNDSADTCRIVDKLARDSSYDMVCLHVPKTVDNDLMGSDHTPGYPSAARFVATAFLADSLDNASLPGVKINVVMGRNAGFLTAAAALARAQADYPSPGPHLIYLPEVPFDTDRFVADVQATLDSLGRCQVAVSEGIVNAAGRPIGATLIPAAEKDAHGNVQLSGSGALGDLLASLVKQRVKLPSGKPPRVRADTLGYLQRCWPDPSPIDAKEARASAKFAARAAAKGQSGSVAILREPGKRYRASYALLPFADVAAKTRTMPADFMSGHNDVTKAFLRYARPLVGPLPEVTRF